MKFCGMTGHNPGTNRLYCILCDLGWKSLQAKRSTGQVFANNSVQNCRRQSAQN